MWSSVYGLGSVDLGLNEVLDCDPIGVVADQDASAVDELAGGKSVDRGDTPVSAKSSGYGPFGERSSHRKMLLIFIPCTLRGNQTWPSA